MAEPLTDAMVDDLVSRGAYKAKAFQIVEAGNSRGWTFRRRLGQMWKYGRRPLLDQIVELRTDLGKARAQLARADDLDRYVAEQMDDPAFAVAFTVARDGRVRSVELGAQKLRDHLGVAVGLLRRLAGHETDPCQLDHHGYCQTHGLHESPCPIPLARQLLERNDRG